jgi:hypothetical protein
LPVSALLLPAGEFAGALQGVGGQTDELEEEGDALLPLGGGDLSQSHRQANVLGRWQHRDEAEGLEDERDLVSAQCGAALFGELRDGRAVDDDRASVRLVEAADAVEQGGLSGTGAADQGRKLAAADPDGDVSQGVHWRGLRAEGAADTGDLDHDVAREGVEADLAGVHGGHGALQPGVSSIAGPGRAV